MDDTGRLLERINYRALEARRDQVPLPTSERNDEHERFLNFVQDLSHLLRSGEWVHKSKIKAVCKRYRTGLDLVGEILGIAETDDGEFYCWPDDTTPELPPEKRRA